MSLEEREIFDGAYNSFSSSEVKEAIILERKEYNIMCSTIERELGKYTVDIDLKIRISNLITQHFRRKKEIFGDFKE